MLSARHCSSSTASARCCTRAWKDSLNRPAGQRGDGSPQDGQAGTGDCNIEQLNATHSWAMSCRPPHTMLAALQSMHPLHAAPAGHTYKAHTGPRTRWQLHHGRIYVRRLLHCAHSISASRHSTLHDGKAQMHHINCTGACPFCCAVSQSPAGHVTTAAHVASCICSRRSASAASMLASSCAQLLLSPALVLLLCHQAGLPRDWMTSRPVERGSRLGTATA